MPCGIFLLLFILLFVFRRFLPVHGGAGAIGGDFLRRLAQFQPAAVGDLRQQLDNTYIVDSKGNKRKLRQ